jgi:glycosyltransferase involved in cell wall biosynthesis
MRGAEVLILPSIREGVGLPVIEAVACGTPVIVTNASPVAAILGEAAISIDPNDTSQIARALEEVLGNPATRAKMRGAALALSDTLGWKRSARAILQIFQEEFMLLAASRRRQGSAGN